MTSWTRSTGQKWKVFVHRCMRHHCPSAWNGVKATNCKGKKIAWHPAAGHQVCKLKASIWSQLKHLCITPLADWRSRPNMAPDMTQIAQPTVVSVISLECLGRQSCKWERHDPKVATQCWRMINDDHYGTWLYKASGHLGSQINIVNQFI